jgi:hypothetical protein
MRICTWAEPDILFKQIAHYIQCKGLSLQRPIILIFVSRLVSEEPTKQITNYRWFPADFPIRHFVGHPLKRAYILKIVTLQKIINST